MQNIDFSKMTDEELTELAKQLRSERQTRKALTKESLSKSKDFYRALAGWDAINDAFDLTYWTISEQLHMNILAICDYILGNYKVLKNRRGEEVVKRNGAYVEKRYEDYKELYRSIADALTAAIYNYQDKKGEK
jgi:hypothetical protein